MNNPILHLNLKRQWFDMIKAGEKREEYRAIKPYYLRLFPRNAFSSKRYVKIKGKRHNPEDVIICFSNGYAKDRDQVFCRLKDIKVGSKGRESWGARPGQTYFVLILGDIIK